MIRYRNGAYEVSVYVGRDPVTGKERSVSRTVRMAEGKRIPKAVRDVEATLRLDVSKGLHGTPHLTVGDLLTRWLDHARRDLSPTTVHGYERSIRLYLKPLGKVKLAKLTTGQIDRLYDSLTEKGLSPATIRQAHAILHRACHQAMRWGWLHANPASLADPPSVKRAEITAPSPESLDRITRMATDDLACLIRLARGTGARRGELCGLRFSDCTESEIVISRSVVEIEHKLTVKAPKSGKPRRVAIGPNLAALIKTRKAEMAARALRFGTGLGDAYVLSDAIDGAQPLHPNLASDRFRRLAKSLDLSVRLHDLRHAYATTALANGAEPAAVAAQLGHASTKMTLDVYSHATPEGQRAVGLLMDGTTPT